MSISTTTRKAGPYVGNGVQTVFAFAFKIFAVTDVVVVRAIIATGAENTFVNGVDYTVSMNGDQDGSPGGTITVAVAPTAAHRLIITSEVPQLQSTIVTNGGGFFPSVFNGVFDKLTVLVQQLAEKLSRTLKIAITASGVTSLDIPVIPFGVLRWNAGGTALETVVLAISTGQIGFPAVQNPSSDPNTLDDYVEGSFSMGVLLSSVQPTGMVLSTNAFVYTKVGKMVVVNGTITVSNKGSGGVGALELTGLPKTAVQNAAVSIGLVSAITLAANERLAGYTSGTAVDFHKLNLTGTGGLLSWADISNGFTLMFSVSYIASA